MRTDLYLLLSKIKLHLKDSSIVEYLAALLLPSTTKTNDVVYDQTAFSHKVHKQL